MSENVNVFSTARQMLRALRAKEVSARQLLELHLQQIERWDGTLNSVVVRDFDRARRDADAADARFAAGDDAALLGLPVTLKESIDVAGLPTTAGVAERRDHVAAADALTVRRLRIAGAVVVGKTNVCTWLADYTGDNPIYGRTSNPWDLSRTSGGSSAGSAALASGMAPIEIGSDLGGSIRVPAAYCGLVGHKPSETLVPNSGHFPGSPLPNAAWCLSAQGPHARSAGDVRLALDVVMGPDVGDDVARRFVLPPPRRTRLADFRLAVLPVQPWLPVDADILAAADSLFDRLRKLGTRVDVLQPPQLGDLRQMHRLYRRMMYALISVRWSDELRRAQIADKEARPDEFFHADARGIRATAADYLQWHGQREVYRDALRTFFADYDLLLTPMTLTTAFKHTTAPVPDRKLLIGDRAAEFEWMSFYPGLATLPGHPATAFPIGLSSEGLPMGLQAIGPFLEDYTPLHFAELLEQEFGGFVVPPMLR
jgi:amidase